MKNENLEDIFKELQGKFDTEEPHEGHELRFLDKLNKNTEVVQLKQSKVSWWKPLSIAASIAILLTVGIDFFNPPKSMEEKVAEISPEVANTQFYFASLIEDQIKELENESTPETKRIVDDAMHQLKKLEADYKILEDDLVNGGNSKLILSAMITNFQTRIDLLTEVMDKIETIKTLNEYDGEMGQNVI